MERLRNRMKKGYDIAQDVNLFMLKQVLKPRVLMVNEVKPADFDHYLACTNCGTVYPKTETKIEPEISHH